MKDRIQIVLKTNITNNQQNHTKKRSFPSLDWEVNWASRLHTSLSSLLHCGHWPESEPRRELTNTHTVHTHTLYDEGDVLGYSFNACPGAGVQYIFIFKI